MDQNKKKIALLIFLILVMIALWAKQFLGSKSVPKNSPNNPSQENTVIKQMEKTLQSFYQLDTLSTYFDDTLWSNITVEDKIRNPFFPAQSPINPQLETIKMKIALSMQKQETLPSKKPKPRPDFKLNGIIYDKNKPSAIINSKLIQVGDTLLGYRISKITPKSVELVSEDEIVTIKLPEEKILP